MKCIFESPIGPILIEGSEKGISTLVFIDEMTSQITPQNFLSTENQEYTKFDPSEMTSQWTKQLDEYFQRKRKSFELDLDLNGTEFQKRVWNELLKIPFGKTISYNDLSLRLGNNKAIRAVAAANGENPVGILVPCHRVVGSDGSLTGYAGGLWRKQWLLNHESGKLSFPF